MKVLLDENLPTRLKKELLMRSQDGLHYETNSLSLRSGERGAWERRDRFQAMFSRLSPLPGPLPARSTRGGGVLESPPAPCAFVAYPADSSVSMFDVATVREGYATLPKGVSSRCSTEPRRLR
jgi:hypothetical protein